MTPSTPAPRDLSEGLRARICLTYAEEALEAKGSYVAYRWTADRVSAETGEEVDADDVVRALVDAERDRDLRSRRIERDLEVYEAMGCGWTP